MNSKEDEFNSMCLSEMGYSIRRYFVDDFFSRNILKLEPNSKILDVGGKRINKRGMFNIEDYKLDVKYLNIDKSVMPDYVADASKMPIEALQFDAIILGEVLEHVKDPRVVLKECLRVLKVGGKIIATIPFLYPIHGDPFDYGRYTKEYWLVLEKELKCRLINIESQGTYFAVMANFLKLGVNEIFQKPRRLITQIILKSFMRFIVGILINFDKKYTNSKDQLISGSTLGYGLVIKKI